jgi:hypothetical protein
MTAEQKEEWDMRLNLPLPGQEARSDTFTAEQEADSFMAAFQAQGR